jgi:hypothetical protein
VRVQLLRSSAGGHPQPVAGSQFEYRMKTQIQELIACYKTFDEITQIIESENSGLTSEQRLSEIETTIKKLFQNL